MQVQVRDGNVERALRELKRKLNREGWARELRNRREFTKPSKAKALKKEEGVRRMRKTLRRRFEKEGF